MKWIDTQQDFDSMIAELGQRGSFAIDTEADSLHSYFDKVCLIQITSNGDDWIIDPLAKLSLDRLGGLFADPAIVKFFHGADYDLRILNRDFGFEMENIRDTMICAQLLGYEAFGLAALLQRHFKVELDKSFQRADWSKRPLTKPMLHYAAMDTRYLAGLVEKLEAELRALDRWEWALEEFERLQALRYVEPEPKPDVHMKIKGAKSLVRRELGVLSRLVAWRDGVARKQDRPPFKVMSNETLITISTQMPPSVRELREIKGMSPGQMSRYKGPVLAIVDEVRLLRDDELPEIPKKKSWKRDKAFERRVEMLRIVRDDVAQELNLDGGLVAPRHVLSAIADDKPTTTEELHSISTMRRWQIKVAGERLIAALAD